MREQVALKEKRNSLELLFLLLILLGLVCATLVLFHEERLWLRLIFLAPERTQPHIRPAILSVVWSIVVTDLVARYFSMACKIFVTLCLCATPHRRLRQLYRLSEMCAAVYRSALPMPQWYAWLLADGSSHLFSSLVTGLYLTFKLAAVIDQLRTVSSTCRSTLMQQSVSCVAACRDCCCHGGIASHSPTLRACLRRMRRLAQLYGRYATEHEVSEVASDETCSICHDELNKAVILSCKHIFCEECVCEWLERERTCPLCRAVVSSGPSYQSDGTAPLMCQLF